MEWKMLSAVLRQPVIFEALRDEPLVCALRDLLAADGETASERSRALAAELYPRGGSLTDAVWALLSADDNFYIRARAAGKSCSAEADAWLERELAVWGEAASVTSREVCARFGLPEEEVPVWRAERADFSERYRRALREIPRRGYGLFARHYMFTLTDGGELLAVAHPDPQRLSELYGYEKERGRVLRNTRALLRGVRANNILLYGDAGTGKSSTVKAVVNEYHDLGLRLVQVEKGQLRLIPALLDRLSGNPLKFILFIDDLSFASDDRDFTALKTVLEGSVSARSANTVIYATSNRRHLVQETFQNRQGDEIHLSDTLEEVSSLSARFGLVVTFGKPDKEVYLEQVDALAAAAGVVLPAQTLHTEAEAFALRAGGRSPRAARQYIEYKIAERGGEDWTK